MKLAVVGSRGWAMPSVISKELDSQYTVGELSEVVTGGALGVDSFAEAWCRLRLVPCRVFKPNWSVGKRGAAIRNRQIVDYCDWLIAFWDGKSRGTKMSIDMAAKAGKLLKIIRQ